MAQQAVLKLTAENAELVRKLDQTTRKLKHLEGQVNKTKGSSKGMFDPLKKSVGNASGPLGAMGGKFSSIAAAAGSVSGPMAAAAGGIAAVGIGISVLSDSLDVLKKLVGETKKLARETGMSAEASSAWIGIADRFNLSAEQLSASFGILSKNIHKSLDPGTAGTKMQHIFEQLGVSAGQLKSGNVDSILMSLADGFKQMGPGTERTNAAMAIFGRGGKNLIPILQQGAGGLKELKDKMAEYGLVIGDKTIGQTTDLSKAQKDLQQMWGGFQIFLATTLLPWIAKWTGKVRDLLDVLHTGKSKGDKFKQSILDWKKVFDKGISFGKQTGLLKAFTGTFTGTFQAFKDLFHMKWMRFGSDLMKIMNPLHAVEQKFVSWLKGLSNKLVNGAVHAVSSVKDKFVSGFNGVISWISSMPGKLSSLAGRFASAGRHLGQSFISAIGSGLNSMGSFLSDIGNSIRNWINQNTLFGDSVPIGPLTLHIPKLARGGMVNGAQLSMIGEDGPEAVIPLSGKYRARGAALYAQAGAAMGLNGPAASGGHTFNIYNTGSLDENALAARMAWQLKTRAAI